MPGRKFSSDKYRYGFNGQEKSDDIFNNSYSAEYWEYDTRIARRWNIDLVYKNSPYETFASNPISFYDPNGLDSIRFNKQTTIIIPRNNPNWSGGSQKPLSFTSFSISTTPKEGPDVFTYTESTSILDGNGEDKTISATRVLHPEDPNSTNGVTKGKYLYFDGLFTSERNNKDWESVGKFMNLDKSFYDYMIARNPNSSNWRADALALEAMELLMPVLVQSGLGAWGGYRFGSVSATSMPLKYDPRVRIRSLQDPRAHNFPYSFDKYILSTKPILHSNGYKMYRLEGTIHGRIVDGVQQIKKGFYEVGVTKEGIIDHRNFVSN